MLLPSKLGTLAHNSLSTPVAPSLYNHTSSLLILLASMSIISFVLGCVTVNVPVFKLPCLKCRKNPLEGLAAPRPSSLYKNDKFLPAWGESSTIVSDCSMTVLTISKFIFLPSTVFVKPYTGTPELYV